MYSTLQESAFVTSDHGGWLQSPSPSGSFKFPYKQKPGKRKIVPLLAGHEKGLLNKNDSLEIVGRRDASTQATQADEKKSEDKLKYL